MAHMTKEKTGKMRLYQTKTLLYNKGNNQQTEQKQVCVSHASHKQLICKIKGGLQDLNGKSMYNANENRQRT